MTRKQSIAEKIEKIIGGDIKDTDYLYDDNTIKPPSIKEQEGSTEPEPDERNTNVLERVQNYIDGKKKTEEREPYMSPFQKKLFESLEKLRSGGALAKEWNEEGYRSRMTDVIITELKKYGCTITNHELAHSTAMELLKTQEPVDAAKQMISNAKQLS